MSLRDKIKQKKKVILDGCFNFIAGTYPPTTSQLLKQEKDRFLNPVGYTVQNEIETIFDELTGEMNSSRLYKALEGIIKIRAVQDFSPSEAVGFVFMLKKAVRETAGSVERGAWSKEHNTKKEESMMVNELLEFEQRIDGIALMAFDIYMECREKIHNIKIKEIKHGAGESGFSFSRE
ncbi:MAG: RsbRD N-terminal domain-containing protein [Deltaproteobacteria bacterium]